MLDRQWAVAVRNILFRNNKNSPMWILKYFQVHIKDKDWQPQIQNKEFKIGVLAQMLQD